ncbi:MAG: glycosyltransferase family 4 protein [Clostridia bacterium]|nr:glycosyltransferase family 4 protein [Clostridia bacterium]
MKVALIHDHLAQEGGAEKVLKVLSDIFPEAPIYTLLYDKKKVAKNFADRHIESSVIQRLPGGIKHYKWYLPFMPMAVEFFDLRPYDLVISDASAFAKGVITSPNTTHICYCHTPTRYLWSDAHQYLNELKYNKWLKKIISLILGGLRIWDYNAAQRVDYYIANSKTVAKRINKYYRRSAQLIYPPVETEKFMISDLSKQIKEEQYFLIGCRLTPYKRVDIVIEAFKKLGPNYRLKVFGDGHDLKRLKNIADLASNIEFLGRVDESEKAKLYSEALAFINPQEEDFGITTIESMAAGRPVLAYNRGGASETIIAGRNGLFFEEQSSSAIANLVREFSADLENGKKIWDSKEIKTMSDKYSINNFKDQLFSFLKAKNIDLNK